MGRAPAPLLSVVAQALDVPVPALVWENSGSFRRNTGVFRRSLRRSRGADLPRRSRQPSRAVEVSHSGAVLLLNVCLSRAISRARCCYCDCHVKCVTPCAAWAAWCWPELCAAAGEDTRFQCLESPAGWSVMARSCSPAGSPPLQSETRLPCLPGTRGLGVCGEP